MHAEKFAKPKTLKEAGAIINTLNMPKPAVDRLMALARMDGIHIKDDLYHAVNETGDWELSKARAYCALSACTAWFEANLLSLGYDMALEDRVSKAVAYGPDFVTTVQLAAQATDEGDKAKRMLQSMLAGSPQPKPAARPTKGPSAANPPMANQAPAAPAPRASTPENPASANPSAASNEAEKKFFQVHVYGGKAAACFSADTKRNSITQTVRIETAECTAARVYAWDNKIALQLSVKELPLVLGVLMGWLPAYKAEGHGENNDKGFTIERQEGKFFLSMFAKGQKARALPIPPGDAYCITSLLLRQMVSNDPHLSSAEVLKLSHAAISVVPNATGTRH